MKKSLFPLKKRQFFPFLVVIVMILMIIAFFPRNKFHIDSYFLAESVDKGVLLEWNLPVPKATLLIQGKDAKYTENVSGSGKFNFTKGGHGQIYTFSLRYNDSKQNRVIESRQRMIVDFEKVTDLMTLHINTQDGQDPTCEKAQKPEGMKGGTIINNNYKKAIMNDNISVKIKVRGNSSGLQRKKPYKLAFKEKVDLLELGEEYADREWYLIAQSHLKTYFGLQMGKIVGMEWEPRMRFVNLVLNGDWKGLYILCEAISRHPKRIPMKKKGFLIESDAYFWNKKGVFFGSPLLDNTIKFTFKYPKITSKFDPRSLAIQKQIRVIDDAIKTKSPQLSSLIDFDTFVAWGISHDVMGAWDGSGSNKYFYKYNMNPKNKLKMGPVWDFDSIFGMKDNEHAAPWFQKSSYLPYLMKNTSFKKYYKQKYLKIAPSIESKMASALAKLKTIPGLEESRKLDAKDGLMITNHWMMKSKN